MSALAAGLVAGLADRERLSNFLRLDPEESILVWAWTRHAVYRSRYEAASADPGWEHLRFVRLQSPKEVDAFMEAVAAEDRGES